MKHVFNDPKPHLPDSSQWTSILRHQIPKLEHPRKAELASMLWTLRSMGTTIQNGKLVPLIHPESPWESEDDFNSLTMYLVPFRKEIKSMIERANEDDRINSKASESL